MSLTSQSFNGNGTNNGSLYHDPTTNQLYSTDSSYSGVSSGTTTTTKGTDTGSWILGIVIAVLVIIGIIVIIWWATSGSGTSNGDTGPLSISGSDFKAVSATSIQATWTAVGNATDVVTLYVNPTGEEMKFNANGSPVGSYSTSGPVSGNTRSASGNTGSATVSGLKSRSTYDAILIVTNPDVSGFNGHHHESGITVSPPLTPGNKFFIQAAGQSGSITYSPVPGPNTVTYSGGTLNMNQSLLHRDKNGFICATTQTEPLTANSLCEDGSYVLYADSSTGTANLSIKQKQNLTREEMGNAQWVYNSTGDNNWCLQGVPTSGVATTRCMLFSIESPVSLLTSSGTVPVTTGGTTTFSTIGGSSFVTVDNSTVSSDGTVTPIQTAQPVFVTEGAGSKWTNNVFKSE